MGEPPIRQAIQATLDTVVLRASRFRNLVVLVVALIAGVVFASLFFQRFDMLSMLLWLLPMVCVWMALDVQTLQQWQVRVVHICDEGKLDIEVFRTTILQLKHLPQVSIASMTELLAAPDSPDLKTGPQRESLSAERRRHITKAALSSLGCLLISLALATNGYWFLVGLAIFSIACWLR